MLEELDTMKTVLTNIKFGALTILDTCIIVRISNAKNWDVHDWWEIYKELYKLYQSIINGTIILS